MYGDVTIFDASASFLSLPVFVEAEKAQTEKVQTEKTLGAAEKCRAQSADRTIKAVAHSCGAIHKHNKLRNIQMTSNTENIASTSDSQTARSGGAERENAAAGSGRLARMSQADRSGEGMLDRQRALIGDDATERLRGARVLLFGVGGVGGYVLEALVRAGVGAVGVVDFDVVSPSNLNRQIIATASTVGRRKTELAAERARSINPELEVTEYDVFATAENIPELVRGYAPSFVIDAIDCTASKIAIIAAAKELGVPVISSMGTGNKLDPTRFRIGDISETRVCPLAKVVRIELRRRGITDVPVLWSDEDPVIRSRTPASVSFVPSVAGLLIAGYCIRRLAGLKR